MTSHAPAIPRRLIDIAGLLSRVRRKRGSDDDDFLLLHMHKRPLLILKTTAGDLPAILSGSCLYEDTIVMRYAFVPPADLKVLAIVQRLGTFETVVQVESDMRMVKGQTIKMSLALGFLLAVVGEKGTSYDIEL